MGKSSFFFKFFSLIFAGCLFCTACENFLNGDNIRDEIVDQIYIANHECPVATVEEPVFSDSGVARNKSIIVSFTMAIDPKSFESSYQITDSQGNNLMSNFLEPKWSNENKVVTIAANEQNLIDLKGKRSLDIFFTLSTSCKTPDGLPISSGINHKYRINDSVDNTAPTLLDNTYIARSAVYFKDNLISDSKILYQGAITEENEWLVCNANHINSTLNIYVEGNDYGGGAVRGHIYCRRLAEVTGISVNEPVKDFVFNLFKQTENDLYSGLYTLDLSSVQDYQDGLYEIKVYVQDTSNLDSENCKLYYVIRDTSMAYSINSRIVNDTPYFRSDYPEPVPDNQEEGYAPGEYESKSIQTAFNQQVPTLQKIDDFRNRILFDQFNGDVYYTSDLTNKTYAENDLTYFVSWGLEKEHLTNPVKIEGQYYINNTAMAPRGDIKYYTLPQAFHSFLTDNEDNDIILKVIALDGVGNQNELYSLWPKKIDFYNYQVSPDTDNKKKVKINFADVANDMPFEDKIIHGKWRIFYGPLGNLNEDDDLSELELIRNCAPYVQYSDSSDLLEIKELEANGKYVVFIQSAYDSDSVYNGQYNCTTFGPVKKIIVDTSKTGVGTPRKPKFSSDSIHEGTIIEDNTEKRVNIINHDRMTKGPLNSSQFDISITISDDSYEPGLTYIPYYQVLIPRHFGNDENGEWTWFPDDWEWVKLEPHTEQTFTITVKNNLIAPLCKDKAWDCIHWDMRVDDYDPQTHEPYGPDNTYFQAVENCRAQGVTYTPSAGKLIISAANDTAFTDSDVVYVEFCEDDDNIPPAISSEITKHDSHLSFDGHCFEFSDLIREDEGNLTEYFTYYYTPYNHAWGDNLNVLSESQIQMLPSGRAIFTGSCWLDETYGADYRLDTSIPVYGLPDGDYMYFAKLEDRYGNYTYATLGKAHVGTFKNKLKVELDDKQEYFRSSLELEPDESFFDRNMISVQAYWDKWDNYYEWLNELQNCRKDGNKLSSYIPDDTDLNTFYFRQNGNTESFITDPKPQKNFGKTYQAEKILDRGQWYRITMQSFNCDNGVNYRYGRPYTSSSDIQSDQNSLWNRRPGWVDGEQKYDLCTDETVSNTVYYYVPWENNNDREDFSDYYASFFSSTATPRSNHSMLVNVLVSNCDLGQDADEWERRGKLVATHKYDQWDSTTRSISCDFNQSVAAEDVSKAREQGLVYYAAVVHFAKGESAVSDVYTMYGF